MPVATPVRFFPRPTRRDAHFAHAGIGAVAAAPAAPRFDPADFVPALQTELLILQPTPFCNIACDYCYLPDRDSTARMSLATVRLAARRLREDGLLGATLGVVWHAGEPLAMPVAFYADAIAAIDAEIGAQCRVSHAIQTNAMLIDDAWCALFKAHAIRVGVSIDGPAELHDRHRRTRRGKGTHAQALHGIERLRAHGIEFHAIAVVTAAALAQPDAFYDFFATLGVRELGCNVDEAEGAHAVSSIAGHEAAHAAFLAHLLERSLAGGPVAVRELTGAFQRIATPLPSYRWRGHALPRNAQTLPFALLTVACNGDFATYSPELLGQRAPAYGDFILGNVARAGYLASTASPAFARLWHEIARGTQACERGCSHFGFCGGGAPANKFYENGDLASAETLYCRTTVKHPFDAVLARLEQGRRGRAAASAA